MESFHGITAHDVGSLLSFFEEAQPMIVSEMALKSPLTAINSLKTNEYIESTEISKADVICHGKDVNTVGVEHLKDLKDVKERNDLTQIDPHFAAISDDNYTQTKIAEERDIIKCDEDFSDSSWTDDSSSESSDYPVVDKMVSPCVYRGRGCNFRRIKKGGGSGFHGRGRSQNILANLGNISNQQTGSSTPQFYDKLPTYYTALSRPTHGIVRSIHLNPFELEFPDNEQPTYESLVLDKVPSYQSCFTNSIKYDAKCSEMKFSLPYDDGEPETRDHFTSEVRKHFCRAKHTSRPVRARSRSRGRSQSRGRSRGRSRSRAKVTKKSRRKDYETFGSEVESVQKSLSLKSKSLERRIVYIGRIPHGFSKGELVELFERFGKIAECSVHFRETGDNYGFVTYETPGGSARAVENGNRLPGCEHWDICFGGRRKFCKADYTDLDGNMQVKEEYAPGAMKASKSFDELLRDTIRSRI